ncbi:ATP-binding protein [Allgaiera indica]|uniref:ATP-binding protein n=1 Tax=Allgaiera indica TaxID=765699 RepID=UPI000AF5C540|nr:ATP-binding protein [Allgaiera indica]
MPGWLSAARAYALALVPLVALMVVAGVYFDATRTRAYMAEVRADLADRMDAQRARIEGRVTGLSLMLRGLEAAIEADPGLSQKRYAALARFMTRDNPEILNIAAAPGLVVKYVYPQEPNAAVLGFDYHTDPVQLHSVEAARKTGHTILAGPLRLLQDGREGYIIRMPVFLHADNGTRGEFWGVLSLVIDAPTFYLRAGLVGRQQSVSYAMRGPGGTGAAGPVFWGDPKVFDQQPMVQDITLPYGSWQLGAVPAGGWPTSAPHAFWVRLAMLVVGLFVLGSAGLVLFLMRRHRDARAQLLKAIGAIDDGFALFDAEDRLVMCNDRYRSFYSVSADLIRPGVLFEDLVREGVSRGQYPAAEGREEEWIAERMAAHRGADAMVEQQLEDGRWLRISERRMADGSIVGFRVDVTELKLAKDAAEEANRAKADFLSVLSHELRTPLTVILGFARFLSDRKSSAVLRKLDAADGAEAAALPEAFDRYIEEVGARAGKIETSGNHLLMLINDLLDFSKIEAGKLQMSREMLPLSELVVDVVDQFSAQAQEKGLVLTSEVGDEQVFADPIRLRQVLLNLVGNAIKFTDEGAITVRARRQGDRVAVSVEDTGCGIPAEMTERVFREFQQADNSSTRRAGGAGLGLAIVRRIVELHGGEVSLQSFPGKGSTFTFTIPVRSQAGASRSAA